jgi:hypothetical protein
MTRRQVDDQPADLAFPHRDQLGGDELEMPIRRQLGLRVELVEAARGKQRKVDLASRFAGPASAASTSRMISIAVWSLFLGI